MIINRFSLYSSILRITKILLNKQFQIRKDDIIPTEKHPAPINQIYLSKPNKSTIHNLTFSYNQTTIFSLRNKAENYFNLCFLFKNICKPFSSENHALKRGILFHKGSQILVAEKHINVQFLVPFPKNNFTMKNK